MTQDCDKTFLRFDSKDSTPLESFPSAAPSLNLTPSLDATSWEHVDKLCEQLLHCSKVSVERWKAPLVHALAQLDSQLTESNLIRLAGASAAQARAEFEVVNRRARANGANNDTTRLALGDWWYLPEAAGGVAIGTDEREHRKEKRREIWRAAAMLLTATDDDDDNDETDASHGRHLRDMSNISTLSMDEAWLEVEALEKVALLSLHIETTETSLGSVQSGESTLGVSFDYGVFQGAALFGREGQDSDFDEDDLNLVERLGGTFRLVTTKKSLPRLERVIEFLAFTVISLRLEAVLLEDLGCPRPNATSPTETACSSSANDDSEANIAADETEGADSSTFDPKLPGSYVFEDGEPDDDWGFTKRSWRSSFSNSGVLAWMRLANPRAQLPHPLKSSRSLRRSSTLPSSNASPVIFRAATTIPARTLDSPSPSPSPSRSPDGKRHKVATKLRGIRDQLRDRIARNKHGAISPGGSDSEEDNSSSSARRSIGGKNTGMLGLQIAGIDLKATSWSNPWSAEGSREDVSATRDDVSVARAEVTASEAGEKQPPKRFEKVIEDLSRFILSTSPDVLYPPPHLLFRLRQQELEASLVPGPSTPTPAASAPPSPCPLPCDVFDLGPRSGFLSAKPVTQPRLSALQRAHALPSSHSLALNFAEGLEEDPKALEVTAETRPINTSSATRIGLDARASLASLMTNNSSTEGTIRHQAMQFLVQVLPSDAPFGASPCEPFRWLTLRYYDSRVTDARCLPDVSLETFVRNLVLRQTDTCSQCDRHHRDHLLVLLHHDEKLEVSLSQLGQPSEDSDHVSASHMCASCDAQSTPTRLSALAGSFSFAKFIELVSYDPNFYPLPELCEHASTERSALVRCFSLGATRVQIKRSSISLYELRLPTAVDPDVVPSEPDDEQPPSADSTEVLREEIARFYQSIRPRLEILRSRLVKQASAPMTALVDDAPQARDHVRSDSEQTIIDIQRPTIPSISQVVETEDGTGTTARGDEATGRARVHALLRLLEQFVDREERACQGMVDASSPQELNVARAAFRRRAEALLRRLDEWRAKHLGVDIGFPACDLPQYFSEDVIALPIHSSVLLRTGELSSILAVALSTPEFKEESRTVSAASSRRVTPSTPTFTPKSRHSSLRLPIPTFASDEESQHAPDPDDLEDDFSADVEFQLVTKLKKPPRASGSVFRNLVRKKSGEISGPSTPSSEHGSFALESKKRTIKDSVLNDFLKTKDVPATLGRSSRPVPSIISGLATRREGSSATTLSLTDEVLAQFTSSGSAAGSIRSKVAPSSTSSVMLSESSRSSIAETESDADKESGSEMQEDDELAPLATEVGSNSSRLLEGIRSGLDSLRTRAGGPNSPRLGPAFEESLATEHVKLKMTFGDQRWTTTAFYARRFKDLRARCGLSEGLFIDSLSRCNDLNPSGGKSSAAFLITGNSRFMLKELVTKFGYSELESLLTFAPRLLDYQMQADRPSLLSKIFGIYTIKIQDLKTGEKRKLDLIVMDNLFHSQTISRQFDLKGIASRVAKPKPGEETSKETGWDSDWLEGSVRNQLLLYPHSRTLLLDSISNDVEFLSSNGNIDFSLLVGVDDTKCTLVVGLIDTLGVFNTFKVLESSAKKGLKMALSADASSVTVCPPTEYAKRFLAAMETYFVAVPDKWSKPPRGADPDPDPRLACPL